MRYAKIETVAMEFEAAKMNYETETKERIKRLIQMDFHIRMKTQDEDTFYTWIMRVPDESSLEDYEFIAEDNQEYFEICELFAKLILSDAKSGNSLNMGRG